MAPSFFSLSLSLLFIESTTSSKRNSYTFSFTTPFVNANIFNCPIYHSNILS
jgi:hypothetical protein